MEMCIEAINGTKWLIEYQVGQGFVCNIGKPFAEFQKVYSGTNENIAAYLELADFNDKNSALSVMASGDHSFNLVTAGVKNIDTFDTNKLTEYYALGFKRAMILKYDYCTFVMKMILLSSTNVSVEEISELISGLLPYMEPMHANYWKNVVDFNYRVQKQEGTSINLFQMITLCNNAADMTIFNNYLKDEVHYELLRSILGQVNISFKCANAYHLAREFLGKYDFILLSNILDYFDKRWGFEWGYEQLQKYESELEGITSPGGIIFLKYIYNYGISERIIRKHAIIGDSSVTIQDLTDEEVYKLSPKAGTKAFDGMILKRVK